MSNEGDYCKVKIEESDEESFLFISSWSWTPKENEKRQWKFARELNTPFMCANLGRLFEDGVRIDSESSSFSLNEF